MLFEAAQVKFSFSWEDQRNLAELCFKRRCSSCATRDGRNISQQFLGLNDQNQSLQWIRRFASSYTDVASIKESLISQNIWEINAFRDNHGGALRPDMFKSKTWELKNFFAGYPSHFEKNKSGQLICDLERTTANTACSSFPPTGRPMSLSIWWFDVGLKIRTPHNKQRGLEQRDWNREREGRKGRTIDRWTVFWLKMAAVFTADYEGLYSIHRGAVGVVCDSAQQNQEPHSKANQQVWCLLLSLWEWKLWLPVTFHCTVYRFVISVIVFHVEPAFVVSCLSSKAKHIIRFDQWMWIPWPDSWRPRQTERLY